MVCQRLLIICWRQRRKTMMSIIRNWMLTMQQPRQRRLQQRKLDRLIFSSTTNSSEQHSNVIWVRKVFLQLRFNNEKKNIVCCFGFCERINNKIGKCRYDRIHWSSACAWTFEQFWAWRLDKLCRCNCSQVKDEETTSLFDWISKQNKNSFFLTTSYDRHIRIWNAQSRDFVVGKFVYFLWKFKVQNKKCFVFFRYCKRTRRYCSFCEVDSSAIECCRVADFGFGRRWSCSSNLAGQSNFILCRSQ